MTRAQLKIYADALKGKYGEYKWTSLEVRKLVPYAKNRDVQIARMEKIIRDYQRICSELKKKACGAPRQPEGVE